MFREILRAFAVFPVPEAHVSLSAERRARDRAEKTFGTRRWN
jgi:hypothetical protein